MYAKTLDTVCWSTVFDIHCVVYSEITKIFFLFQNDVISCAQQVELLEQQLATRMEQLQATVQSKTAVPTAQVYVSFKTCINGKKNQRVITVSKVVFEKYMKANRKQKRKVL